MNKSIRRNRAIHANYQFHAGRKGAGGIYSYQTKQDAIEGRKEWMKIHKEHGHPLSVGKITKGDRRPTSGTGLQKRYSTSTNGSYKDKHGVVHHYSGYHGNHANLHQMPMKMFEGKR